MNEWIIKWSPEPGDVLGSLVQTQTQLLHASEGLPCMKAHRTADCLARKKQWRRKTLGMPAFLNSAPALPPPKLPCFSGAKEGPAKKG